MIDLLADFVGECVNETVNEGDTAKATIAEARRKAFAYTIARRETLSETLRVLGLTTRRRRGPLDRLGYKDVVDGSGTLVCTGTAGQVWDWLYSQSAEPCHSCGDQPRLDGGYAGWEAACSGCYDGEPGSYVATEGTRDDVIIEWDREQARLADEAAGEGSAS